MRPNYPRPEPKSRPLRSRRIGADRGVWFGRSRGSAKIKRVLFLSRHKEWRRPYWPGLDGTAR